MAFYEAGISGVAAAAGAAYATIHGNGTVRARIEEIGFQCSAATASPVGLIRPANTPVATTSQLGAAVDAADPAATVNVDTAWSTAPTIGTNFLRKAVGGAAIGSGVIWTWPKDRRPIIDKTVPGLWLVLWNFSATLAGIPDLWVVWEE